MRNQIQTYLDLTKARLASLVVTTTVVGFLVAPRGDSLDWTRLFWTTLGTALSALGSNAFNQCMERHRDARMRRTEGRPLPAGRIELPHAIAVSSISVVAGFVILAVAANWLTALLALLIHVLYLGVYTPLKPRTPSNTLVGAVCGAIPPVMGWTAATNQITPAAGLLFLILFIWQMPHFLALAWLYREDYERGGYRMLPVVDRSGVLTGNLVVLYSLLLLPLVIAVLLAGLAGWFFVAGGLVLGGFLTVRALQLRFALDERSARRLFLGSLAYLPLLLGLLVADRGPALDRHTHPERYSVQRVGNYSAQSSDSREDRGVHEARVDREDPGAGEHRDELETWTEGVPRVADGRNAGPTREDRAVVNQASHSVSPPIETALLLETESDLSPVLCDRF